MPQLALVTGASGFLGTECVLAFVDAGFSVRGTIRKQIQADQFFAKFPEHKEKVEFVIVGDIEREGAFDKAVKGVDVVAHTASPARFDPKDNEKDILLPAINGTTSILKSAAKSPSVKAVVVTSSITAYVNPAKISDPTWVMGPSDWNPTTYEEAAASPDGTAVYRASKALAEKAAWKFMEDSKPYFTLTTLAPTWILGKTNDPATKSLKSVRSSYGITVPMIIDTKKAAQAPHLPSFINVRDVAAAHVKAVQVPQAAGKRYLVIGGRFSPAKSAQILRKAFPQHLARLPEVTDEEAEFAPSFAYDSADFEKDLGIAYTPLEETIKEWGAQVLALPLTE
ncbi:ketoreductase [Pseudohyphozyma bogoriensis]|nr:ketoreductase [Pseudohyphozyma bogoriensis]